MSPVRNAAECFAEYVGSLKFCANWFYLERVELSDLFTNLERQCVNVLGLGVMALVLQPLDSRRVVRVDGRRGQTARVGRVPRIPVLSTVSEVAQQFSKEQSFAACRIVCSKLGVAGGLCDFSLLF